MPKKIKEQRSSDSTYYHPDFHIALNHGIEYLHIKFDEKAVKDYLEIFAEAYFKPLTNALNDKGLIAIKEHYERIYKTEKATWHMDFSQNSLEIHLYESPAVMHIRSNGQRVSPMYRETVSTVNKTICRDTAYGCELLDYQNENGGYRIRFFKRDI